VQACSRPPEASVSTRVAQLLHQRGMRDAEIAQFSLKEDYTNLTKVIPLCDGNDEYHAYQKLLGGRMRDLKEAEGPEDVNSFVLSSQELASELKFDSPVGEQRRPVVEAAIRQLDEYEAALKHDAPFLTKYPSQMIEDEAESIMFEALLRQLADRRRILGNSLSGSPNDVYDDKVVALVEELERLRSEQARTTQGQASAPIRFALYGPPGFPAQRDLKVVSAKVPVLEAMRQLEDHINYIESQRKIAAGENIPFGRNWGPVVDFYARHLTKLRKSLDGVRENHEYGPSLADLEKIDAGMGKLKEQEKGILLKMQGLNKDSVEYHQVVRRMMQIEKIWLDFKAKGQEGQGPPALVEEWRTLNDKLHEAGNYEDVDLGNNSRFTKFAEELRATDLFDEIPKGRVSHIYLRSAYVLGAGPDVFEAALHEQKDRKLVFGVPIHLEITFDGEIAGKEIELSISSGGNTLKFRATRTESQWDYVTETFVLLPASDSPLP
jgi:hypothetical protein